MLHAEGHSPHPLFPTPVSHCPLQQHSPAHGLLQSHLGPGRRCSCSGEQVCIHSLKTKLFFPKGKEAGGREAKGKAGGEGGQKGRGSCGLQPQPCLNPFLLVTAPVSVGLAAALAAGSCSLWRAREGQKLHSPAKGAETSWKGSCAHI